MLPLFLVDAVDYVVVCNHQWLLFSKFWGGSIARKENEGWNQWKIMHFFTLNGFLGKWNTTALTERKISQSASKLVMSGNLRYPPTFFARSVFLYFSSFFSFLCYCQFFSFRLIPSSRFNIYCNFNHLSWYQLLVFMDLMAWLKERMPWLTRGIHVVKWYMQFYLISMSCN